MSPEIAGRLAALEIQLVAETGSHYLFARENCIVLVERTPSGFGSIGSTGFLTDFGLAYLVWRDGSPFLLGKGAETAAEPGQVQAISRFASDLKSVLG